MSTIANENDNCRLITGLHETIAGAGNTVAIAAKTKEIVHSFAVPQSLAGGGLASGDNSASGTGSETDEGNREGVAVLKRLNGQEWLIDPARGVYFDSKEKDTKPIRYTDSPVTLAAVLDLKDGRQKAVWRYHERQHGDEVQTVTDAENWLDASATLKRKGLRVDETPSKQSSRFADFLQTAFNIRCGQVTHLQCIERNGWIEDSGFTAFAYFDRIIAADDETSKKYVLDIPVSKRLARAVAGTVEEWKRKVAWPCFVYSRLLSCGLMASFAGPLLRILLNNNTNPAFFLVGKTGTGKTTFLDVACSVFGVKRVSLSGSAKGMEAFAALCNDLFFAGDELQTAGRKIQQIIYLVGNGDPGVYQNRNKELVATDSFVVSGAMAGELSVAETLIRAAGRADISEGAQVRCLAIPIDETKKARDGKRLMGVFDAIPADDANAERLAKQLNEAAAKYTGVAGEAFIQQLVQYIAAKGVDTLREEFKKFSAYFRKLLADCGVLDQNAGRAVDSFAVYAFAGVLGIRFGLLPWRDETAATDEEKGYSYPVQAVGYAFRRWLGREDSKERLLQQAAEALAVPPMGNVLIYPLDKPDVGEPQIPRGVLISALTHDGGTVAVIYPPDVFRETAAKKGGISLGDMVDYLMSLNGLVTNHKTKSGDSRWMFGRYTNRRKNKLGMAAGGHYFIVVPANVLAAGEKGCEQIAENEKLHEIFKGAELVEYLQKVIGKYQPA